MRGKDRKVSPRQCQKSDARKFKRRVDLLTFAQEHPGALGAHFANAIRVAIGEGPIKRTADLRKIPYVRYITSVDFGLSELRDKREALTLATIMEHINKDSLSEACDIIASRLLALQEAKSKGGTWEKAATKELIPLPGASGLQPSGLSSLT